MGSSTFHNFVLRKPGSHTLSNSCGVAVVQLCARSCVHVCQFLFHACFHLHKGYGWRYNSSNDRRKQLCVQYPGMVFCTASCPSFYVHRHGSSSWSPPPPKHLLMSSEISHNNVGWSDSGRTLSGSPPVSSPSLPPLDEFSLSARQWQLLFFKCIERTWGCTWVCVSCSARTCRQGSFRRSERKTRKDTEIKMPICEHRRKPIILLWL